MKVFCIGFHKTGTTTLKICLEELGYKVKSSDLRLLRAAKEGKVHKLYDTIEEYDAFRDWPWPLVYQKIDKKYKNCKFILTKRSSTEKWFKSLKSHSEKTGPTEHRKIVYGHEMPHGKKNHHIKIYKKHNEKVKKYFSERSGDMLEVCWEKGDGWKKVCNFLGHKIPDKSFPHAYKGKHNKSYIQKMKEKINSLAKIIRG
ncbi:sulfotransferase family protein [Salinibacter ruber]|uniref:Sulfotransferase domain-containing protein n=1 Tax=Salinibacter ruber TaxID=146919 RepID=A0A9X2Z3K4_9BACT|nr:sulfotransferase family protein [Salinibacter ruber]MCS3950913.1 hypothetical protein [Salinibacter ruber]